MINLRDIKAQIVTVALYQIGLCSDAAVNLVTGTGLVESGFVYDHQLGGGPALGWFQMEPETHDDIWRNFLSYRPILAAKTRQVAGLGNPTAVLMITNHAYAAAMCRLKYFRSPLKIPPADNAAELSYYHKHIYNTSAGASDAERNIPLFQRAIDGI